MNFAAPSSPVRASCRGWARVALVATAALALAAEPPSKEVELRGRVVCLVEESFALAKKPAPAKHEHVWGLKTTEGRLIPLLRTKNSEALFTDPRLHSKDLVLKGPMRASDGRFEAIVIRSMKDGVEHSLFYFCDICTIRSVAPGECVCCREPVELREIPVKLDRP